jgi:4-amino-4-deoxy-L-arabinose transferase-like glycosyltransferase
VQPPAARPAPAPAILASPAAEEKPILNRGRAGVAVGVLLLLHATLAVRSLVRENPTIDEVVHLPAGVSYWQTGSFRMYHHNPPLVKLLAALPVVSRATVNYRSPAWAEPPNKAAFAHEFMQLNAGAYFELFARARLLMPVFSVIGGLVVYAWSRRLYGPWGGLLSLALWVVCPNVLAHTRLITTDMAATSLGALATFVFWLYLKDPSWRLAALAGLALGLAQLSKFSMVVLYGLWPLLALVRVATAPDLRKRIGRTVAQGLLMVALSVLVIDVGYGFEGVGIPLGRYEFVCQTFTKPVPPGVRRPRSPDRLFDGAYRYRVNRFRGTPLGLIPVPLPKHYMLGFDDQKLEAEGIPNKFLTPPGVDPGPDGDRLQGYPVYLDGELRQKSWWYYYLLALVYKVPEGTWVLVLASLVALARSPGARAGWFDEFAVLTVPAFVLFVMSVFTNINLGLRYVLPVFPFVYVSAGKLAPWAAARASREGRAAARAFVVLGLAASAAATAFIHPHYIAYFNVASGGPDRGARHLIDSNLDWGQDLVNLRRWVADNAPGEPLGLAYFGQINPRVFDERGEGLDWFLPPPAPKSVKELADLPPRYWNRDAYRLRPGLYAVSASLVEGLPWRVYDNNRWAPYSVWTDAFSYFKELRPFDKVGHSIYLYRVTPAQAERLSHIFEEPVGPA